MDLSCSVCHKGKKMDKGFEKYHKWAFLEHQTHLVFNGPNKQINIELNTPFGVISPFGIGGGDQPGGCSQAGAISFA